MLSSVNTTSYIERYIPSYVMRTSAGIGRIVEIKVYAPFTHDDIVYNKIHSHLFRVEIILDNKVTKVFGFKKVR